MKVIKLYLSYAGHCLAKESHAIIGGRNKDIKFHALFGLIKHPQMGWILYDTGYSRDFYKATKTFPNKIYALVTKVFITEENEAVAQLAKLNIAASDIKHIFITHFHADHVGALKDFENATVYCSKTAYDHFKQINPFFSFIKATLKSLVPANIEKRLKFIEEFSKAEKDDIFGVKYDLFNDGSIIVYPLPGHAAGQIGLLMKTEKQTCFLIADGCWLKRTYQELILPPSIARISFNSWKEYKSTIYKIHSFHKLNPEVLIIPTHCAETTDALITESNQLNEV